jgi:hypothetical protein
MMDCSRVSHVDAGRLFTGHALHSPVTVPWFRHGQRLVELRTACERGERGIHVKPHDIRQRARKCLGRWMT